MCEKSDGKTAVMTSKDAEDRFEEVAKEISRITELGMTEIMEIRREMLQAKE